MTRAYKSIVPWATSTSEFILFPELRKVDVGDTGFEVLPRLCVTMIVAGMLKFPWLDDATCVFVRMLSGLGGSRNRDFNARVIISQYAGVWRPLSGWRPRTRNDICKMDIH